jgi:hypothetical protein
MLKGHVMNPFDAILNNIDKNDGISTIFFGWACQRIFHYSVIFADFLKNQD